MCPQIRGASLMCFERARLQAVPQPPGVPWKSAEYRGRAALQRRVSRENECGL
jgi:hypothetical protein